MNKLVTGLFFVEKSPESQREISQKKSAFLKDIAKLVAGSGCWTQHIWV
jgi:hypothetical protein